MDLPIITPPPATFKEKFEAKLAEYEQQNKATTTSSTAAPVIASRRPFRVASRRRPLPGRPYTTTTEPPTTEVSETPTLSLDSEESLQDITDIDDDTTITSGPSNRTKAHRRPQILKEDSVDQNPSATNEDERKRHSKKYSASFRQNQLDEVLKKKSSQEEVTSDATTTTTEAVKSTIEDDAETALAIAAHQLLSAPLPSVSNYDEDSKPARSTKKSPTTTFEYKYTSPTYTDAYSDTKTTFHEYSSTPIYKTTIANQDYVQTTTGTVYDITTNFNSGRTTYTPRTSTYPSTFTARISRPAAFTTANILTTLSQEPSTEFSRVPQTPTVNSGFSRGSTEFSAVSTSTNPSLSRSPGSFVPPSLGPSTARYVGSSEKFIPVPVEDYSLPTGGYPTIGQEPSYFTREYLLESPVTKTYDDEYQYLSPTTPQTTTRKVPKKIAYRKISTTIRPTIPPYVPEVTVPTPRRVPAPKPFEKISNKSPGPNRYRAADNFDYYDDGAEKLAAKYEEGTKVVLHSKGTIECLDIGNFPHPTSCKKFISCARLDNNSLLGWEYICPKGLSFDPVGGICNWSAGLGCSEKDE